ncbi:DNA methyltransferase [Opitutaceae bacterium TAV5]|nr:DNA methyltransferase [Opitutaceae bacterium TAV5]
MKTTPAHAPNDTTKPRPVIAWPGGKTRLLRHLLPRIPEHRTYCEVFGGGLALFCAKPPSRVEVINDISGRLIAFYRVIKFHLPALLAEIENVPNSRRDFFDYLAQPGLTEIQQVARWYVCQRLSFGGQGRTFAPTRTQGHPLIENRLPALQALSQRLVTVTIENLDWQRFLEIYDYPEAFHFFDPPYFDDGGSAYKEWTEEEFSRFAGRVRTLRGAWLLTYQDCPQARDQFRDCRIIPVSRANTMKNREPARRNLRYRELVILPK